MPKVPKRQLSPGELANTKRRIFKPRPHLENLTPKQIRKLNKRSAKKQAQAPHTGSNQFIADTAKAWHLTYKETQSIFHWVDHKVAPWNKPAALATTLRKKYKP